MNGNPDSPPNRRILVIDDNPAIHDDFRKILGPRSEAEVQLEAAEAAIFGTHRSAWFEIDAASQGREGLALVERALAKDRPYAMAFVDMRMPPGWDGMETISHIWEICPDLQVVICTAYSDCSLEEMRDRLEPRDRMLVLKKPFETIEVLQMAEALTEKWRLLQESRARLGDLEQIVRRRTAELEESRRAALDLRDEALAAREAAERALVDLRRESAERVRLEQQFFRAQRLESIGTLAGGIAHDLNNVFAPITMGIDLLEMSVTDAKCRELLATVAGSARRGAEMVSQVLSFARGVEGRKLEVQARHVIAEVEKIVRETFPKNLVIETLVPRDLPAIEADPTQLHQVLINLCVNARDAMPAGGRLTIEAADVDVDAKFAAAQLDGKPGPHVRIRVSDTGSGIPKAAFDKIFDPFFTTKEVGKGTGLGLSTSLAIVRSHGGFIHVSSGSGGTVFSVFLPALQVAAGGSPPVAARALPRGDGQTVLVVDDEAPIRRIAREALETFGYRVLLAADGAEACEIYARHGQDIDAVLTDMMMPSMDGPATIRQIRRINPGAKIIAASGLSANTESARSAGLVVQHFLAKPYSADVLLKTLHEVLAS